MLRRILPNVLLVCLSLFVGYVLFEIGVRLYMQHKYLDGNYQIHANYVEPDAKGPEGEPVIGWEKPNRTFYYYIFGEDSGVAFFSKYHSNNVGLISQKDYFRKREGKEYRIAIVGDSFTAALQMRNPWPDRLEDLLDKDAALKEKLGVDAFRVYNFGLYSAGFDNFYELARKAATLDPDMIVVNFIGADFPRCNNCPFTTDNPYKAEARRLVSGTVPLRLGPGPDETAELSMSCEQPPISFANPTCRHSFQLSIPPRLAMDKDKVRELKKLVVADYLRGQLWRSLHPYGLMLARGKPVDLHHLRNPELYQSAGARKTMTDAEQVDSALRYLTAIRELFPGKPVLVVQHPTYEDMTAQPDEAKAKRLMEKDPSLRVTFMRPRLPADADAATVRSWYCVPYDGHMSDAGGAVYAPAMEGLIRETLLR